MSEEQVATEAQTPDQNEPPKRREVRYTSLPGLLQDAEQLANGPHKTTGGWTYGQILDHLACSLNTAFDDYNIKMPIHVKILGPLFFKKKFLTQELPGGFPVPRSDKRLKPEDDITVEEGLARFRTSIQRFEKEVPSQKHAALGKLTPEEWVQFHLRHAELHMSHVWPA